MHNRGGNPRFVQCTFANHHLQGYPVYAEADVAVDIDDSPPDVTTARVQAAIEEFLRVRAGEQEGAQAARPANGGQAA